MKQDLNKEKRKCNEECKLEKIRKNKLSDFFNLYGNPMTIFI